MKLLPKYYNLKCNELYNKQVGHRIMNQTSGHQKGNIQSVGYVETYSNWKEQYCVTTTYQCNYLSVGNAMNCRQPMYTT